MLRTHTHEQHSSSITICHLPPLPALADPRPVAASASGKRLRAHLDPTLALGSVGYDDFLALCQAHNVRICVLWSLLRDEPIDTDEAGGWMRYHDEVLLVQKISTRHLSMYTGYQSNPADRWTATRHEAPPHPFEVIPDDQGRAIATNWTYLEDKLLQDIVKETGRPTRSNRQHSWDKVGGRHARTHLLCTYTQLLTKL